MSMRKLFKPGDKVKLNKFAKDYLSHLKGIPKEWFRDKILTVIKISPQWGEPCYIISDKVDSCSFHSDYFDKANNWEISYSVK